MTAAERTRLEETLAVVRGALKAAEDLVLEMQGKAILLRAKVEWLERQLSEPQENTG